VSVGNLAVGGTGKTPCVVWLARELRTRGERPVVLSRGYGRVGRDVVILEPGAAAPPGPDAAGDEPIEILEGARVPVVVGRNRGRTARLAVERLGATCLVLDDAFQHRPLRRDFDLVLLDAARPFGNGRLLPAGPLREPPGALGRADAVLLTRAAEAGAAGVDAALIRGFLGPQGWIGRADHVTAGVEALAGRDAATPPAPGTAVFLTAGVARPASFAASAAAAGFRAAGALGFPDHFRYTERERLAVERAAGTLPILTTRKDAVRWRAVPGTPAAPWFVMGIEFRPREAEELLGRITAAFERARAAAR
jgi:tetraacyldisaccharide 4'-kinase